MEQIQILNNGDTLNAIRTKINENFAIIDEKTNVNPLMKFTANSGNETDGVADLLTRSEDGTYLTFKVGGDYPNLVYTDGSGKTFEVSSLDPLYFENLQAGIYIILVNGTSTQITTANIHYQLVEPTEVNSGDIWFNGNGAYQALVLGEDVQWMDYPFTPIGEATFRTDKIAFSSTYPYNSNRLHEASSSTFGLLRTAAVTDELDCNCNDAVITPANLYDLSNYRMSNTTYEVDQKVGCPYYHNLQLTCIQAGTTSNEGLNTRGSLEAGTTIEDGTVIWQVEELGVAGGGLPMFAHIWSDHIYNDVSYLRADNFSWHSGGMYITAYDILEEQYNNEKSVTKTENGITYKLTPDNFKIADITQEDIIRVLYETEGIAWFYIIDTENKRFKLPRVNTNTNQYLYFYVGAYKRPETEVNLAQMGEALNNKVDLDGGNYKGSELEEYVNDTCLNDKRTNCITEIPQRIKLELNNGTLTLKAGSIVTVPNGFEADGTTPKFDYVTIENDVTRSTTSTTAREVTLFYSQTNNTVTNWNTNICFSGDTAPSTTSAVWYDTKRNKIYYTTDGGANWQDYKYSLPIAIATLESSGFSEIKNIFNGFGYIGSTIWVDKGVKGLIPDGRNEDGSLKNLEFTTDGVWTGQTIYNWQNATIGIVPSQKLINYVTQNNVVFNDKENKNILVSNGNKWNGCFAGQLSVENLKVTAFNPKLPFMAIDYQEAVKKSGDTMTGGLAIQNPDNYDFTATTAPSSAIVAGTFAIADKNGNIVARLQNYFNQYDNMVTHITANRSVGGTIKTAALQLYVGSDGAAKFDFPKCTTKATTTSTAHAGSVAVVVQNYVNGTSWYRVWSDGWKEQGGMTETVANAGTATVAFLKAFSNTNYTVVLGTTKINQTASGTYNDFVKTKTASNFTVVSGSGGNATCAWYACGY